MSKTRLKKLIIENTQTLIDKNLNIGSEGNISQRTNDGFLITPSGVNPKNIKINQVSHISLNGDVNNKVKPSSEWGMHLKIYNKFNNVNSIVHTHSVYASVLSCSRENIPSFHYMIAEFGGKNVRCSKYAVFGSDEIGKNVLIALKNRKACLISNHGQITIGKSFEEAIQLAESLEKISKQFYLCKLLKNYKLLTSSEMDEVIDLFDDYKSRH
ncbi:MAG: class II aldolase [Rickettsiales bacterium]|nr:class II aldolase [Rickettsiales bacterium]OUV53204.1 MAG: hypothetical protein CBC87_04870 [Rickettsiales bacterium TMED127]|tara:strand:- start:5812 stop:6450 length:639 start_codon:yes stop_codon:yes gene_type:complete